MRPAHYSLIVVGLLALSACAPPDVIKPYRMDIQQGNYVSQEMVSQLKVGMTKEQVRYVLGTPLVADIFHADRWDYVYYKDPRRGTREGRKIAVIFENGKLARVTGDVVPAEPKSDAAIPKPKAPEAAPQPSAPQSVAEPPKPVAEAPKPADEPAKSEPAKDEVPQAQSAQTEQQTERGFFGRILEKLGL